MPSPPPKSKPVIWLKEIQSKQLSSLQSREQQLLDIIEDIRSYSRLRADIERAYGQALIKLANQILAKKELFSIEEDPASEQYRTIQSTWKSCLEETEIVGQQSIKTADVLSNSISEKCKTLKSNKSLAFKKALDQLTVLQSDLAQTVKEFGVFHKQYTDDETNAYDARTKATTAENRLNNKETGIFTSVDTLKKNSIKLATRMNDCTAKSASSRNSYLLELAAVNSHTKRLHTVDVPQLFQALDEGVFEQIAACLSQIASVQIDASNTILSTHGRVVTEAEKCSPQYNLDCYLKANPVFSEQLLFQYDPVQGDPINNLTSSYNEGSRLEKETRNWARKVAKESKVMPELQSKLQSRVSQNAQNPDPTADVEIQNLQNQLRRCEIAKLKAEARLSLLKVAGMPVDAILAEATSAPDNMDNQSIDSWSSAGHSSTDGIDSTGEALSTNFHRTSHNGQQNLGSFKALVLYNYQANMADELSLAEGEVIDILDMGIGDGWFRARNSHGHVGLVPENYIEAYESSSIINEHSIPNVPLPEAKGLCRALYDYVADGEDELSFEAGQIITIISKNNNGVDDGYWKGEVNGVVGMFPDVVVEEINFHMSSSNNSIEDNSLLDQEQPSTYHQSSHVINIYPPNLPTIPDSYEPETTQDQPAPSEYNSQSQNIPESPPEVQAPAIPVMAPPIPQLREHKPFVDRSTKPSHYIPTPALETLDSNYSKPVIDRSTKPHSIQAQNKTDYVTRNIEENLKSSPHVEANMPPWERSHIKTPEKRDQASDSQDQSPVIPSRDNLSQHPRPSVAPPARPTTLGEKTMVHINYDTKPLERNLPQDELRLEDSDKTQQDIYSTVDPVKGRRQTGLLYGEKYNENPPARPSPQISESPSTPSSFGSIENRRFRNMQPVPHQYYIDVSEGKGSSPIRHDDKDRNSSSRSFESKSSNDSQDTLQSLEKQIPIRLPGRRNLSTDASPMADSPQKPLSLHDINRLLPQTGLVNPSYRVAIDLHAPTPKQRPQSMEPSSRHRKAGGLPGHVRQGIVQGKQALDNVNRNDFQSAQSPTNPVPKTAKPKNETSV